MLDFLLDKNDAIHILKKDHENVDGLFDAFKDATKLAQKKKIAAEVIKELKIHTLIEEELFYPALRGKAKVDQDLLNESDEEHHVAKFLIAELEQMNGTEDHYIAKFTVLSENVRHHVKEEERDLFPQARKTTVDFIALGKKLQLRKQQLLKHGIPENREEKMLSGFSKLAGDSPAHAAKRKSSSLVTKSKVPMVAAKAKTRVKAQPVALKKARKS